MGGTVEIHRDPLHYNPIREAGLNALNSDLRQLQKRQTKAEATHGLAVRKRPV